jgi:hypothetical protein
MVPPSIKIQETAKKIKQRRINHYLEDEHRYMSSMGVRAVAPILLYR